MKPLMTGIALLLLQLNTFSQEMLPEVRVISTNYKYLRSVDDPNAAQPVRLLEHRAASYDLKNADFYEEDNDNYFISFYIPNGQILAFYDNTGKILHAVEKYKNVALPRTVQLAVAKRFPGWSIPKDVYVVSYYSDQDNHKKTYKLVLENGTKRIRVKTNEKGEFIE